MSGAMSGALSWAMSMAMSEAMSGAMSKARSGAMSLAMSGAMSVAPSTDANGSLLKPPMTDQQPITQSPHPEMNRTAELLILIWALFAVWAITTHLSHDHLPAAVGADCAPAGRPGRAALGD